MAPPAKRGGVWAVAAITILAVAGVAGWYLWGSGEPAPEIPVARSLTRMAFDSGLTADPAISPDGKLVAYVSDRASRRPNLWLQQVDGGQAIQLTDYDGGVHTPSFSPDGTRIVYDAEGEDDRIYVIPTIGGDPQRIAPGNVWMLSEGR